MSEDLRDEVRELKELVRKLETKLDEMLARLLPKCKKCDAPVDEDDGSFTCGCGSVIHRRCARQDRYCGPMCAECYDRT